MKQKRTDQEIYAQAYSRMGDEQLAAGKVFISLTRLRLQVAEAYQAFLMASEPENRTRWQQYEMLENKHLRYREEYERHCRAIERFGLVVMAAAARIALKEIASEDDLW